MLCFVFCCFFLLLFFFACFLIDNRSNVNVTIPVPVCQTSYSFFMLFKVGISVVFGVSGAGNVENRAHPDTSNTLCGTAYWYGLFAKCMLANQRGHIFKMAALNSKWPPKYIIIHQNPAQEVLNIVFYRPNMAYLMQNIN